ncbi:WD repeat, SAM and U-box domain-containing protein 1-like [Planococcus citri]|uniref:WD repeat, SAM and U-box domain-containing protein 1-like n=1 Tax=Planococcus citri TaxID=170843 RepID=UPI0031F7EAE7
MPKQSIEKVSILQTLNFHSSDVTSCHFDEHFRLVSGSSDKKVVVCEWKPEQGYVEVSYSPITEYKYGVTKVEFIPEENELITSSLDGSISIFNCEDGELLHILMHVNLASVRTFCYISENKHLLSAGEDGSICVWNLTRKTLKKSAQIHDETISTACISADSKIVLTGDSTGFVKLWHVSKFLESENSNESLTPDQCICDCHDLGINHADFSPSMNISDKGKEYKVVTGGNDNLVKIWNITFKKYNETLGRCDYELLFSIVGHASAVTFVKFDFAGNMVASTSLDKTTRLWTFEDGNYQCLQVLKGHKRYVTTCCFSSDGSLLATGSNDKTVIVWDLTGERSMKTHLRKKEHLYINQPSSPFKQKNVSRIYQKIENLGNAVNSCAFSKDDFLASGGTDKLVRLWHRSSNSNNKFVEFAVSPLNFHQYAVNQVDFSLCGTLLASCSVDGTTVLWNITEYSQIGAVHNVEGGVKCCKFSPDSRLLATAGDNEVVCIWGVKDLQLKANLTGHTDAVSCLAFSKDSKYLASGCSGGNLRLWCVTPCTTICLLCEDNVHDLGFTSMDFCLADDPENEQKDQYLLVTGGNDSLVKIWQITIVDELTAKASQIQVMNGHGGDITCVRFSPSSSHIVASSATDKTARIWDLSAGACLQVLDSKESMLTCCAFTFDGNFIATGTLDKTIIVWDLRKNTDEFETFAMNRLTAKRDCVVTNELAEINPHLNDLSLNALDDSNDTPHEFFCPITHQIMEDPVICADGYAYERSAIESWFQSGKLTSPMTNQLLPSIKVKPDIALKEKIVGYLSSSLS